MTEFFLNNAPPNRRSWHILAIFYDNLTSRNFPPVSD
jgi:hypothetical protein